MPEEVVGDGFLIVAGTSDLRATRAEGQPSRALASLREKKLLSLILEERPRPRLAHRRIKR